MLVRCGVAGAILVSMTGVLGYGLNGLHMLLACMLLGLSAAALLAQEHGLAMRKPGADRRAKGAHRSAQLVSAAQTGGAAPVTLDDQVGMLEDTLTLAHAAADIGPREPIDVAALITDLVSGKGTDRLTLLGTPGALQALAGRAALTRTFDILIAHALGSGSRAAISCDHGTTALAVHVDDDGPGIARSQRAHVLTPRYYMTTPPSRRPGCRAELVIAHRIIEAHGGEIVVGCSPLGGGRFTVRLPLLRPCTSELARAS